MHPTPPTLRARVSAIDTLSSHVKAFHLTAEDDGLLPGFSPGAHIAVTVPSLEAAGTVPATRSYSLLHLDPGRSCALPQRSYWIAVRREDKGTGGSLSLHEDIHVGDPLTLRAPVNAFPLDLEDPHPPCLIAGGIGVTPIATMGTALAAAQRPFTLHYSARTAQQLVLSGRMSKVMGASLRLYTDDDEAHALNVDRLLDGLPPVTPLYVCGPQGMIDAVRAGAAARGWSDKAIHFESFLPAGPQEGDQPFDVEFASTGEVVTVPADKSLLDVLIERDLFILYDCKGGTCGLCAVPVLAGEVDHRDQFLTDRDRDSNTVMQACVSRGKGRIRIDL